MKGHKLALGLFFVLIASGCAEMNNSSPEAESLNELTLSVEEVEAVTGAEYTSLGDRGNFSNYDLNMSSAIKEVDAFFTREGNLSEAPESVQSIVVALNSSQGEDTEAIAPSNRSISIEGYEARQLNSTNNSTILYGEENNISFFVKTEGEGIYSSTRQLYVRMAREIEDFNNS